MQTEATLLGALIMFLAAVLYGFLWFRNYRISKVHPSPIADLQWRVPMSSALISTSILLVLLSMVAFRRYPWATYIDPVVSLIMAAFILFSFFGTPARCFSMAVLTRNSVIWLPIFHHRRLGVFSVFRRLDR